MNRENQSYNRFPQNSSNYLFKNYNEQYSKKRNKKSGHFESLSGRCEPDEISKNQLFAKN